MKNISWKFLTIYGNNMEDNAEYDQKISEKKYKANIPVSVFPGGVHRENLGRSDVR